MSYAVVIPAFNAARTLSETLESVLAQTLPAAEIMVVDDASSDETGGIAASFGDVVRVIRCEKNAGPGNATTVGMKATVAPVLALVDADDLWVPEKIARQMRALEAGADLVFSLQRQFRHGVADRGDGQVRPGQNRSSVVFRRKVFDRVGAIIDPPGKRGDFVDWLARVREAGFRDEMIDEVLALRRIIPGSMSWGRDPQADRGYLAVAHRALQRRRKQEGK